VRLIERNERIRRISLLPAAVAALALCACGVDVTYKPTNSAPRAKQPRSGDAVQVLMSERPARPYLEVGVLEARQRSTFDGGDALELLKALREEAGRRGCEAIIVAGPSNKTVGAGSAGGVVVGTLKGYRAACIVFR
jgi:hypothetical protein